MNFTAIDFETANFKRESVCSIGLAMVEDFKIVKTFKKLIKPTPNYFERINMSIHHITPEMVENELTFLESWEEFQSYFENQQLVAHNASFDFSALRYVLNSYQIPYPTLDYYCSMNISKFIYPELINYQLPTVCKHLKINGLSHHDATSDAVACANIMIQICKDYQVSSLDEIEKVIGFSRGRIFPNSYNPFCGCNRKSEKSKQLFNFISEKTEFDMEHPFYNKRIAFTGELSNLSRNDAKQIVVNIGGIVNPDSLSSKTNYLVVGSYDYNNYGEGFKSTKLKSAEKIISQGNDLEIISEIDFFQMIHLESTAFEIKISRIEDDSKEFLRRNKFNDFSEKRIYFSSDLSIDKLTAFKHVGNCGGYGHDYDESDVSNSDFFIISTKHIEDLENGLKSKSIIDFEKIKNEAQNRGNVKSIKLISESVFLAYIERRMRCVKGEIEMNIYEWEIE